MGSAGGKSTGGSTIVAGSRSGRAVMAGGEHPGQHEAVVIGIEELLHDLGAEIGYVK